MMFSCTCPTCEHVNHVDWSWIGRELYCAGCGKPYLVPAPMETIGPSKTPADSASNSDDPQNLIRFRCPGCNKKYSTTGKLSGKKVRCKGCGISLRVPGKNRSSSPRSRALKRKFSGIGEDDVSRPQAGESASSSTARRALPGLDEPPRSRTEIPSPVESGEDHRDDAEESVDGLMPILEDSGLLRSREQRKRRQEAILGSRSEAMERVSREVAEEEERLKQKRRKQARQRAKQRKKRLSYFDTKETVTLVAWVSLLVANLAAVAWGFPQFRFMLGCLLCVVGFIIYLLGWAAIKQLAYDEGDFRGLAFRFFPPYQWWFVWSRWGDTREYAIFFAVGLLIVALGGSVIRTSPAGQRAEQSERAYQKMLSDQEDFAPQANDAPTLLNPGE